MKKTLLLTLLSASLLYSNDMVMVNTDKSSGIVEVMIQGKGESCKVSMNSAGVVTRTDCVKLTNSKKVKILCTKRKKMCKTQSEVVDFVQPKHSKVERQTYQNCLDNASSNYSMKQCTGNELKYQDGLLNRYYKQAMQKLEASEKERLKKAQRAWIKFRDLECDLDGRMMRGGTGESLLVGGCLVDMTKTRAGRLREIATE